MPHIGQLDEGLLLYIGYQLLSMAVQSLNAPTEQSGPVYSFVYRFLSLVVADFKSFSQRPPSTVTTQLTVTKPAATATPSGVL